MVCLCLSKSIIDGGNALGSSTNIIEASWLALADSLEYWLQKQKAKIPAEKPN